VLIMLWVVVFEVLVWRRHDRYGTVAFDLGIHDQAIWLMARGRSFLTVRGMPALGHHATFGYWLLAPLSWLGAGPQLWNLLQVVSCGLGAVPLYALARTRLPAHGGVAAALGATWLLQPSLQFLVWESFHPEVMAATPLMAAYAAGARRAWGWYAGFLGLALSWKEDVALVVLMLGLLHLLGRRWRVGLLTAAAGVAWLAFTVGLVVPAQNDGRTFYGEFYGELGDTPSAVVRTGLQDPTAILERLSDNDATGYAGELLVPVAGAALAAPEVVALGLPQAMVNLLSTQAFTHDRRYHYVVLPLVAVALGTVEGVTRLGRWAQRHRRGVLVRPVAGVVVATAALSTWAWGLAPGSRAYDDGYWPAAGDPAVPVLDWAVDQIPSGAGVSAAQRAVPHLSRRDVVYSFPNPWRPGPSTPYGIDGTERGDPGAVEWLLVDHVRMLAVDRRVLDDVLESGAFEVLRDEHGVLLARRVLPPSVTGGW